MSVAFVTGAAGDIGRAICAALLTQGMAVAGIDCDEQRLQEAAGDLAGGGRFLPVPGDVTKMDSIRAAAEHVAAALGEVSVLVNNAGGITQPSLLTTEERHWIRDIELNLNGPWRCIHVLQRQLMRRAPSVIVNIGSVNGIGVFGHPGYSAAKAGLLHLTRFCAVELGKHGVRSIAICPGSVKTQAWEERKRAHPEILDEVASWYPSRDTCTPQDIANLVTVVVGDQARMMNGAIMTLDGGLTAGSDRLASLFAGEPI